MGKNIFSLYRVLIVTSALVILFLACSGCTENMGGGAMDKITTDPGQTPEVMTSSATEPGSQENEPSLPASNTTTSSAPVSITVHSAFKTMKIKDTNPIAGNIFIVINTKLKIWMRKFLTSSTRLPLTLLGEGLSRRKSMAGYQIPSTGDPFRRKAARPVKWYSG